MHGGRRVAAGERRSDVAQRDRHARAQLRVARRRRPPSRRTPRSPLRRATAPPPSPPPACAYGRVGDQSAGPSCPKPARRRRDQTRARRSCWWWTASRPPAAAWLATSQPRTSTLSGLRPRSSATARSASRLRAELQHQRVAVGRRRRCGGAGRGLGLVNSSLPCRPPDLRAVLPGEVLQEVPVGHVGLAQLLVGDRGGLDLAARPAPRPWRPCARCPPALMFLNASTFRPRNSRCALLSRPHDGERAGAVGSSSSAVTSPLNSSSCAWSRTVATETRSGVPMVIAGRGQQSWLWVADRSASPCPAGRRSRRRHS